MTSLSWRDDGKFLRTKKDVPKTPERELQPVREFVQLVRWDEFISVIFFFPFIIYSHRLCPTSSYQTIFPNVYAAKKEKGPVRNRH